ncbi:hypothetical protein F5Y14DRAFT_21888 [Nemania sp. NC0429]|nr:hypothetical protein F5Y14DRAFT_21888 [Nemania sp. NC0429]
MQVNVPNLINAALPERDTRNRNAIILSQNDGGTTSTNSSQNFLSGSFPRSPRTIFVTAESDDFDEDVLAAWRAEGFEMQYFGLGGAYRDTLATLKDRAHLGPCETFGIVAFGEAASVCLEFFSVMGNNPEDKLGVLVAYYPPRVPDVRGVFPGGLSVLVHLAGDEVGVVRQSQIVGFQGKRRVVSRAVQGVGAGGRARVAGAECAYPCYWYAAAPGFAESDLDEYEAVAAELAWSRSLGAVRKAMGVDMDVERVVEGNMEGKFFTRNLEQTMSTYTTHKPPHATYFPTLSGGVDAQELRRFYADYFLSTNPESTKLTLLSRTVGADRVVDELHVSFKHTQEMPWILPGVPPTNKRVEVVVISIVTLRGGKLYHEHVYWDQASVLLQVGLLDPNLLPEKARAKGVTRLPVVGREAARRLLCGFEDDQDDEGEADNELLPGWYDEEDGVQGAEEKKDVAAKDPVENRGKEVNGGGQEEETGAKEDEGQSREEQDAPEKVKEEGEEAKVAEA